MNRTGDRRLAVSRNCSIHETRNHPPRVLVLILCLLFTSKIASGRATQKENVLVLSEVGLSHSLTNVMLQQIVAGLERTPDRQVEFYLESFDLMSLPEKLTLLEVRQWLEKKYSGQKIDIVVALGPNVIRFLATQSRALFADVPIVICGAAPGQAGDPALDSRFTGTWMKLEPAKTVDAALRMFPDTRHLVMVAGTSSYDRMAATLTKAELQSFEPRLDISYFSELEMDQLLEQLRQLPKQTIVLYVSFFQDAAGNKFVNATKALPMIVEASNAPVFGLSDTYLGSGIVGGFVMSFQEQGRATAKIISQLLDGKKAQEIPIVTYQSVPLFDWKALQRWHIPAASLPAGSLVLFHEPDLWERIRGMWITACVIIAALSCLVVYLQYNRTQLKLAKARQSQLSGMLIGAEEKERSRVAAELHDDFSQRLALLALGLENAAESLPDSAQEANRQLHELVNSASELGADLHTLSHRLHSTTLERLGLIPGVSAFCKEFQAQQGVRVEFTHNEVPQVVHADVALCLFRIVQEGLRNVQKHSGANNAKVGVYKKAQKLTVFVSDQGAGFDTRKLEMKEGLGILSMEQRAHLMGGQFQIRSEPGRGTRIDAWVPVEPPSEPENNKTL